MADKWAHGGHVGPKRIKGHKADTRRTRFGGAAKRTQRRTQGGHMADKLRGRGQSISQPALFLLRENPTVNCLGNDDNKIVKIRPIIGEP